MGKDEKIAFLTKFRWIDKYATFSKMMPAVIFIPEGDRMLMTDILDHCALELIHLLNQKEKPLISDLKKVLSAHMDDIARSTTGNLNKDFAYELCWYMAEKCGIDLRRASDAKIWGFWKVERNRVKTIGSVRKKKTATAI